VLAIIVNRRRELEVITMAETSIRMRMSGPERRTAILRAAREQFALHGFHGAGTASIARAAGCSEAVLYRHFASKKALLAAVLDEEVWGGPPAAPATHPLLPDAAIPLPDVLAARLADPDTRIAVRMILLAISLSDDSEVGPTVVRAFGTVRERVKAAIEASQAAGRMRSDVDVELLTWLWHGLLLVAGIRQGIRDDGTALQAIDAARVLEQLLRPGR
jgi:AcrR family transcriptional regulator